MERGSRQTRSLAAPNWTRQECIALVNEINAVEGEWQHTLSSFQIWQLVVENCNAALHLNRSLNQCKKKWAALLADFKKVKSRRVSYWSFSSDERKELDLPEEFDSELFRAIDAYLKQKDDDGDAASPDSDPETDPDIQPTVVNKVCWETGPKKKRKITPRKRKFGERYQPWGGSIIGKMKNEPFTSSEVPELPVKNIFADVILDYGIEDVKEKKMATQISENVELMNALLQENSVDDDFDCKLSDLKNVEAMQINITRRKGDRLINCLSIIVNTLNQLCDHVQSCK